MTPHTGNLAPLLALILAFEALHAQRQGAHLAAMELALADIEALRSAPQAAGGFNVFVLLGVGTDEVTHSAFLAWLLDAHAGHGQGDLFLRAFLAACRPPIELALPERYHIQTEFAGLESIVDVVLYEAGVFLIYIENKTVSDAGLAQHDRELRDMRRLGATLGVLPEAQHAVFLTPRGIGATGDSAHQWHRIAYTALGTAFDALLPDVKDTKTCHFVQDWLDTLIEFAGTWRKAMTGFTPESLLIAEHWSAVQEIIRAKENLNRELTELFYSFERDLKAQDWWDQGWEFRPYKDRFYIVYPQWYTAQGRAVLYMGVFDVDAEHIFDVGSPPQFYVIVREGYDALRQEMKALVQAAGHTPAQRSNYLILRDLQKCATERQAALAYPDAVRQQVVHLFTEHATLMMCFDVTIKEHIATAEAQA